VPDVVIARTVVASQFSAEPYRLLAWLGIADSCRLGKDRQPTE
jgi:hypothetical protein